MRLNKHISESGICSRREADAWIAAGRVTVNGATGALGTQVRPGDEVRVDGKPLPARRQGVYIALHKPSGITSTTERDVPGNIIDFVGHRERIFPIGRLDKESEGLILLTNDGDIVNEVLREEHGHEKEYLVTVEPRRHRQFPLDDGEGRAHRRREDEALRRSRAWPGTSSASSSPRGSTARSAACARHSAGA